MIQYNRVYCTVSYEQCNSSGAPHAAAHGGNATAFAPLCSSRASGSRKHFSSRKPEYRWRVRGAQRARGSKASAAMVTKSRLSSSVRRRVLGAAAICAALVVLAAAARRVDRVSSAKDAAPGVDRVAVETEKEAEEVVRAAVGGGGGVVRTAKIVTCPRCRLNSLPLVKKFVYEHAKLFEPALKVDFKIGEDPHLYLFEDDKEVANIDLAVCCRAHRRRGARRCVFTCLTFRATFLFPFLCFTLLIASASAVMLQDPGLEGDHAKACHVRHPARYSYR